MDRQYLKSKQPLQKGILPWSIYHNSFDSRLLHVNEVRPVQFLDLVACGRADKNKQYSFGIVFFRGSREFFRDIFG